MIFGIAGILIAGIGFWIFRRKKHWQVCPPVRPSSLDALLYLKPGKNQLKEREQLWRSKILMGCYVLLGGSALLFLNGLWQRLNEDHTPVKQIERPEPGEGEKHIILNERAEGAEELPLMIAVKERMPGEEEAESALEQSYRLLKEQIRGENPSLDEVNKPLNLITYVEETACHVYWYTDNMERIDRNGIVYTEGLLQQEQVTLTAEISLGMYEREYEFTVMLVPGETEEKDRLASAIKQEIQRSEKEGGAESSLLLPSVVSGKEIVYRRPRAVQGGALCLMVVAVAAGSMLLPEQKLLQRKKEKEEQLMLAYPEIVSKLCLLIGSGLTVRKSWERIIQDYRETKAFNHAYEEMLFTYYELERGMPEGKAYAAFGRRCRLHGYRKLGSLLEQNLKKGTAGLLLLLQEETWQAFEDRRAFAVKLAQEAGTRLLLPMILLLLVVLIICIAPAIMSF